MPGYLYIVPTPIGNLEDMSFRAVRILNEVDLILAEDTRVSGILLKHYEIKNTLQAYHQFNEHEATFSIIKKLKDGQDIALISDAGTPGISDPSYLLIKACIEEEIPLTCLPGATALIPSLVGSGMPMHHFVFWGFLPPKKGRMTKINEIMAEQKTSILYESPHRIQKLITMLAEIEPVRQVSVSREISKKFEEFIRGTLQEVEEILKQKTIKGEIVVVLKGKTDAKI